MIRHGPFDLGDPTAPTSLKVGIVGTDETISAMRAWLEKCRTGVPGKQSNLTNLYPPLPGFSSDSGFRSTLIFHHRWCPPLLQKEMEAAIAHPHANEIIGYPVA